MANREKVMLQCKQAIDSGESVTDYSFYYDVLSLLKEQEAVEPKSKSRRVEYQQIVHRCGNCNEILYRHYKHCPACGKSVKWDA